MLFYVICLYVKDTKPFELNWTYNLCHCKGFLPHTLFCWIIIFKSMPDSDVSLTTTGDQVPDEDETNDGGLI